MGSGCYVKMHPTWPVFNTRSNIKVSYGQKQLRVPHLQTVRAGVLHGLKIVQSSGKHLVRNRILAERNLLSI